MDIAVSNILVNFEKRCIQCLDKSLLWLTGWGLRWKFKPFPFWIIEIFFYWCPTKCLQPKKKILELPQYFSKFVKWMTLRASILIIFNLRSRRYTQMLFLKMYDYGHIVLNFECTKTMLNLHWYW